LEPAASLSHREAETAYTGPQEWVGSAADL